jgi:hypothetical protein
LWKRPATTDQPACDCECHGEDALGVDDAHCGACAEQPAPKPTDAVDHPAHYNTGGIEVIDAIESWELGFHLGNVVKYVARAEHKGALLDDLRKAAWYLAREIERRSAVAVAPDNLPPVERQAYCGDCGLGVAVDEDGLCVQCGANAVCVGDVLAAVGAVSGDAFSQLERELAEVRAHCDTLDSSQQKTQRDWWSKKQRADALERWAAEAPVNAAYSEDFVTHYNAWIGRKPGAKSETPCAHERDAFGQCNQPHCLGVIDGAKSEAQG